MQYSTFEYIKNRIDHASHYQWVGARYRVLRSHHRHSRSIAFTEINQGTSFGHK